MCSVNIVVRIQPSSENEVVFESDGTAEVCLTKNINTTRPLVVDVVVQESAPSSNSATGWINLTILWNILMVVSASVI